jgi:hypothetical protein
MSPTNNCGAKSASSRCGPRPLPSSALWPKILDAVKKEELLRATVSLARLWQWQGKKEKARQMLAEIYNWFTEGFDTVDLKEAIVVLAELNK